MGRGSRGVAAKALSQVVIASATATDFHPVGSRRHQVANAYGPKSMLNDLGYGVGGHPNREHARYVPDPTSPRGQSRSLTDNPLAQPQVSQHAIGIAILMPSAMTAALRQTPHDRLLIAPRTTRHVTDPSLWRAGTCGCREARKQTVTNGNMTLVDGCEQLLASHGKPGHVNIGPTWDRTASPS